MTFVGSGILITGSTGLGQSENLLRGLTSDGTDGVRGTTGSTGVGGTDGNYNHSGLTADFGLPYNLPFLYFISGGRLFGSIVTSLSHFLSTIVYSLSMITKPRGKVASTI